MVTAQAAPEPGSARSRDTPGGGARSAPVAKALASGICSWHQVTRLQPLLDCSKLKLPMSDVPCMLKVLSCRHEQPAKWATAAKIPKEAAQLETRLQLEGSRPEQHAASGMQTCRCHPQGNEQWADFECELKYDSLQQWGITDKS